MSISKPLISITEISKTLEHIQQLELECEIETCLTSFMFSVSSFKGWTLRSIQFNYILFKVRIRHNFETFRPTLDPLNESTEDAEKFHWAQIKKSWIKVIQFFCFCTLAKF